MTIRGARAKCFIANDEAGKWQSKLASIFHAVRYVDMQHADGNKTGSWFPYSIHYEPMRSAMKDFWHALAPIIDREPADLATITWNEPVYGGHFARPNQFADYRDFAIERYRKWLTTQYESLAELNAHWGTDHVTWCDKRLSACLSVSRT